MFAHPSVLLSIIHIQYSLFRSGKSERDDSQSSISVFNGEDKSSEDLRQYLAKIQELCEAAPADKNSSSGPHRLPRVVILDNLHHVSSLGDVFAGFLSHKAANW